MIELPASSTPPENKPARIYVHQAHSAWFESDGTTITIARNDRETTITKAVKGAPATPSLTIQSDHLAAFVAALQLVNK
jgi:hypothetical protein